MQEQLRLLGKRRAELRPSNRFWVEIVTPLLFDGKASKVGDFVIVYKLYLRIRIKELTVEE